MITNNTLTHYSETFQCGNDKITLSGTIYWSRGQHRDHYKVKNVAAAVKFKLTVYLIDFFSSLRYLPSKKELKKKLDFLLKEINLDLHVYFIRNITFELEEFEKLIIAE